MPPKSSRKIQESVPDQGHDDITDSGCGHPVAVLCISCLAPPYAGGDELTRARDRRCIGTYSRLPTLLPNVSVWDSLCGSSNKFLFSSSHGGVI